MAPAPVALASESADELACELVGVSKAFGAVRAVDDVSLDIAAGSLTCLIGPNGAGKSTLLGCISGFHPVDAGYMRVGGQEVTRWPAHRRARHGLATVFQTTRPLAQLDVLDNAAVGAHVRSHAGFLASMLRPPWQWREEERVRRDAREALEIVGLDDRASAPRRCSRSGSCGSWRSRGLSRKSPTSSCSTSQPRDCVPARRRDWSRRSECSRSEG